MEAAAPPVAEPATEPSDADEATEGASEQAGEAFDHLRVLGEWDLFLNFVPGTAMGFF